MHRFYANLNRTKICEYHITQKNNYLSYVKILHKTKLNMNSITIMYILPNFELCKIFIAVR